MNLDKFYQYLENPEELGSTSLTHLTELIDEYPFFQVAQLLYLKNLQVLENIKFNKQLKLTAAYMYDRRFLFEFLNQPLLISKDSHEQTDQISQVEIVQESIPEPIPEPIQEQVLVPIPELIPKKIPELVLEVESDPIQELEPDIIQEPASELDSYIEPEPEPEPEPAPESAIEPEPVPDVRRPIRVFKDQEIVGIQKNSFPIEPIAEHKDVEADLIEPAFTPDIEISHKPVDSPMPDKDQGLEAESDIYKKTDYLNSIERFIPIADIDVLMFDFPAGNKDDLLDFEFDKLVPDFNPNSAIDQPEPDSEYHSRMTSHSLIEQFIKSDPLQVKSKPVPDLPKEVQKTNPNPKPESESVSQEDSHNRNLLDAFLLNQPRIPAPSNEKQVHLDDVSMESLQEDESFMTETLAGIYMKQGYYLRAIKAYEKLSLKYPEKSIYFATQIEKIKELINNQ